MKAIPLLVASLSLLGCAASARAPAVDSPGSPRNGYAASDARVRVMGRRIADGGAVAFGASGVTFFIKFRGTSLDVELERASNDTANHDWFTVVVDGGEPSRFRTQPRTRQYSLARGLPLGEHTIALSKATEGQNGHDRLVAIHADELLQADPLPARRIEYIGNSITAGYGADPRPVACKQGTWYDATHAWLAYGPRVARRVNAQWMLSAISGIGMVRNWNSPGPVMPNVYHGVFMEYADSATHWDFRQYTPDLVVVALGTNDFSDGDGKTPRAALDGEKFVRDYTQFVAGMRSRYPAARMLLLTSPMLDSAKNETLAGYLQRVIVARAAAGDTVITRFAFKGRYTSGCDGHPDLAEQLRMADELEPEVRARMGW
ncbi:MAG TPA: GDSL-type esterase/lipase family protein [Gemmatimonadaceae bacterium]|jgi:lysophospholipase L1-like esterase|nr:GDSL-type esterase/lipase family protein [Gemmatimonadaceae bacterium]